MFLRSKRRLSSYSRRNVTSYIFFLGVLDIAARLTFSSYLCSRRPHQGCWACGSKRVSQGVVDMGRSRYSQRIPSLHSICWKGYIWEVLVHKSETHRDWVCSLLAICVGQCAYGVTSNFNGLPSTIERTTADGTYASRLEGTLGQVSFLDSNTDL
jgi:hypothetical protein